MKTIDHFSRIQRQRGRLLKLEERIARLLSERAIEEKCLAGMLRDQRSALPSTAGAKV